MNNNYKQEYYGEWVRNLKPRYLEMYQQIESMQTKDPMVRLVFENARIQKLNEMEIILSIAMLKINAYDKLVEDYKKFVLVSPSYMMTHNWADYEFSDNGVNK